MKSITVGRYLNLNRLRRNYTRLYKTKLFKLKLETKVNIFLKKLAFHMWLLVCFSSVFNFFYRF